MITATNEARLAPSRRAEFLAGARAELPILIGAMPFGMIYGVLALGAGLPASTALAMSAVVFAGSAQFVMAQLFGTGAPALVIVLTAAIINLRHVLYSASVAPYTRQLRPAWKWLLAYLLTDEAYAFAILHYHKEEAPLANKHWYFLGAGLALWGSWQAQHGDRYLPGGCAARESWSLDFTLALSFIALMVPALKGRPGVAAALAAGLVAVLTFNLPYKLGLVTATLVGIGVGLWVEGVE